MSSIFEKDFAIFLYFFNFFQKRRFLYPFDGKGGNIYYIYVAREENFVIKNDGRASPSFYFFLAPAAIFAVARAFFALFTRRGIHIPRIIPRRCFAAVGAFDFVCVRFYQLVKPFVAFWAFVLQKRHFSSLVTCFIPFIIPLSLAVCNRFSPIKPPSPLKNYQKTRRRPTPSVQMHPPNRQAKRGQIDNRRSSVSNR